MICLFVCLFFFFMLKLLQYCNYIIIVMQIKLMLLLLLLSGCFSMSRKFLLVSSFSCGVCQEVWIILLTVFDPLFNF